MHTTSARVVLCAGHRMALTVLACVATLGAPATVAAQSRSGSSRGFSGPYVALDASRQHVIGGSLVDGVDTLQDDVRRVTSAAVGLRGHVGPVVVGGELGKGRLDGALQLEDLSRGLVVDYDTSSQWHWALTAGRAVGDGALLFGYVSEVTRSFDVTMRRAGGDVSQDDEQGLLRFGLGWEQRVAGPLHLRLTAGTSRADFGGRPTNIEPGRRFEAGVGAVFQF
ncbi:MAG: hypothetical protein R2708_02000 [Vicinamibacterales bacterium]